MVPEYDSRRGTARQRGYSTTWDRTALAYRMAHPLCLGCEAVGRTRATQVVDHIVPHRGDMVLFNDPKNRQPSCKWHHDEVKQQLEALYVEGKASAADLKLDSAMAKAMTLRLDSLIGIDGFPT